MNLKLIEKKWVENFKKCPLVDLESKSCKADYAHQLFYGKKDELYPINFPHDLSHWYNNHHTLDQEIVINTFTEFLHFIGIKIRKEAIIAHLNYFPEDYPKFTKKCFYIIKTLAHHGSKLNIDNPYRDNNGDIFFLLRIESGESITGGQLNLFEELPLPDFYRKLVTLPLNYENDKTVSSLFERIEYSNTSFFITGKAGTGKSTFVHYFTQTTHKKVLTLAFTGIAAINIGGQTIHSFFRFPLKPLMPEDHEITQFEDYTQKYKIIQTTDTFIIDEISMLRSDILEAIDYSLRINGGNPDKIFGGKQLLFIGDIFQLPPIANNSDEVEAYLFKSIYQSKYFFDSLAYKRLKPIYFEFTKSHRQKNDLIFIDLLDKIRIGFLTDKLIEQINEKFDPFYNPKKEDFVIVLTTNNVIANEENIKKLDEQDYTKFIFEAKIEGEFKEDKYPTSKVLELKKYAQIIFIKNDNQNRWVNGTIGKIEFISEGIIEIRLQDGNTYKLEPATWENRRFKFDNQKNKIVSEVIGTFTQFPVKLGWAITIHKSQGLTFDNVIIDFGTGAFINGQVYTALSRCKSLSGISLRKKLRKEDVMMDQKILDFYYTTEEA